MRRTTEQKQEPEAPATGGRLARILLLTAALTLPAQAQLDTIGNGMSDVWERYFNDGELFDPENPDHHPDADPDGDGWTNLQESIAGTDPFSGNPPEGMVAVYITHVKDPHDNQSPEFIGDQAVISWDTLPGKQYTLKASPDLTPQSWMAVDHPIAGDGYPAAFTINLIDTAGIAPEKLFWRVEVEDPHHDSDGDGLSDYEEYLLGSNPYKSDTSGDGVPDGWLVVHGYDPNENHEFVMFKVTGVTVPDAYNLGVQDHPDATLEDFDGDGVPNILDADPHDPQINWEKTPETRYVWLEQVEQAADIGTPLAVNKHGMTLFQTAGSPVVPGYFSKVLWDSATRQWVDLAPQGNMDAVSLGEPVTVNAPAREVYALNDDGTVVGSAMQPDFYFAICCTYPGMVWKLAGGNHTAYQTPYYFFANHPIHGFDQIEHSTNNLSLAADGTYLSWVAGDSWKTHDTATGGKGMDTLTPIMGPPLSWGSATILDQDRILIVRENPSMPNKADIWLIEGSGKTIVTSVGGLSPSSSPLALSLAPGQADSGEERLWLCAMGSVHLETRDGGDGAARWHTPPSMNEGASYLHPDGYALTRGGYNPPTQSIIPPKLWRNAEYTDLNELTKKPESVTITEAIDLASNGIILVQANDDGVMKTGLLMPIEITVVFGEGPGNGANELEHTTSKENLENYLETVKVSKNENIWTVKGKDDQLYAIEIGTDEATLVRALSTTGQTVIFDGHANFGLGPNFSKATHKTINSFTNFGTGATDIPISFRGDGSEPDIMPYINGATPWPTDSSVLSSLIQLLNKIEEEAWAFLVLDATEIKGTVTNLPVAHMPGRWKFESGHGVSAGSPLEKQGVGLEEYHFMTASQSKRVIVSAPGNDVPPLRYKTFFYNACSTGPHFIENFNHGEFIYTNRTCAVFNATRWYVKGLIEEKTTAEILHILNTENADGDDNNQNITYEVKSF